MDEVRVLLVNLRGVLGDVVKAALADRADMIVNSVDTSDVAAIAGTDVEVVVCQADDSAAEEIATRMFHRHRRVKVIAVRDDGRQAVLWELQQQRSVLGDLSPRLLVDTVRRVGPR